MPTNFQKSPQLGSSMLQQGTPSHILHMQTQNRNPSTNSQSRISKKLKKKKKSPKFPIMDETL